MPQEGGRAAWPQRSGPASGGGFRRGTHGGHLFIVDLHPWVFVLACVTMNFVEPASTSLGNCSDLYLPFNSFSVKLD
jgi:hypothetical protein